MYIEVNFSMFRDAFSRMDSENQFSYNGLHATNRLEEAVSS